MGLSCSITYRNDLGDTFMSEAAAHQHPPDFSPDLPIPDRTAGCFKFDAYHANWQGKGAGFQGWEEESSKAAQQFEIDQKNILRQAGLGSNGRGNWAKLVQPQKNKAMLIEALDLSYFQNKGFTGVGGMPFTLDEGLRPFLVRHTRRLKDDYRAAWRAIPSTERELVQELARRYPSTKEAWSIEQRMEDRTSFLELYRKATESAALLWNVMVAVAKVSGLKVVRQTVRQSEDANKRASKPADSDMCEALSWHLKLLSERLRVKAAKYGGIHQVTDVLRGSIIFDTAEQLSRGMDFLFSEFKSLVKWVRNRLVDGSLNGYRDILILLENQSNGHIFELQLHLRKFHRWRKPYGSKGGYAAYALTQLIQGRDQTLVEEKYEGERNKRGQRHGKGEFTSVHGDVYKGNFAEGKMSGWGKFRYHDGDTYEGHWRDDKQNGTGCYQFHDGDHYEGNFKNGMFHGKGTLTFATGVVYVGDFDKGVEHGEGEFRFEDASTYRGGVKQSQKHGRGKAIFANGSSYDGEWKEDLKHGVGEFRFQNGDVYTGGYRQGKMHGFGKIIFADGDQYEGQFKNDYLHGDGKFHFVSGNVYEGKYKDGKKHGSGLFKWVDGEVEALQNEDDERVGEGVRWSADRKMAWKLMAGEPVAEISLRQAFQIARKLELPVPSVSKSGIGTINDTGARKDRLIGGGNATGSAARSINRFRGASAIDRGPATQQQKSKAQMPHPKRRQQVVPKGTRRHARNFSRDADPSTNKEDARPEAAGATHVVNRALGSGGSQDIKGNSQVFLGLKI